VEPLTAELVDRAVLFFESLAASGSGSSRSAGSAAAGASASNPVYNLLPDCLSALLAKREPPLQEEQMRTIMAQLLAYVNKVGGWGGTLEGGGGEGGGIGSGAGLRQHGGGGLEGGGSMGTAATSMDKVGAFGGGEHAWAQLLAYVNKTGDGQGGFGGRKGDGCLSTGAGLGGQVGGWGRGGLMGRGVHGHNCCFIRAKCVCVGGEVVPHSFTHSLTNQAG